MLSPALRRARLLRKRAWQGQHLEPARFFVPFLFHKLAYDVLDLEIGEPS